MRAGSPTRGWRRIAGAAWSGPDDPQIYGAVELDATALLAFQERCRASGHHVTPTHLGGRALAHALAEVPALNVRLVGDRLVPRETIDVFFITAVGGGHDLSGVKIASADRKSAVAIAAELSERVATLRAGRDAAFERSKRLTEQLPRALLRPLLRLSAWVAGEHGIAIPALGLEACPFGSAMVTSIGMLGLPLGFGPLDVSRPDPAPGRGDPAASGRGGTPGRGAAGPAGQRHRRPPLRRRRADRRGLPGLPGLPADPARYEPGTRQVRRVPVVDAKRRVLGVLSINDLALQAAQPRPASSELTPEAVIRTLAAVCAHRPTQRPAA